MAITTDLVKGLRERTGAGVLDCKRALEQCKGDFDKAVAMLREQGLATAAKKATRAAREGVVEPYVHPGAKVASLLELDCETDFVARTPEFRTLAHDLAMQVAASKPLYVAVEDVPAEVVEAQQREYALLTADENKPERVRDQIVQGKLRKFYGVNVIPLDFLPAGVAKDRGRLRVHETGGTTGPPARIAVRDFYEPVHRFMNWYLD